MLSQKKRNLFPLWCFLIFFFGFSAFDSGIINIDIKTAHPFMSLSILIAFSCFASSFSRPLIAGLILGACMDSITSGSYCFDTIMLTLLAVNAYFISNNVFNKNLKAIITLCFLSCMFYYFIHWIFFYAADMGFKESSQYLLQYVLPGGFYTAVLTVPFFFIFKKYAIQKSNNT